MPDSNFLNIPKPELSSEGKKKDNYLLHIGLFIITFITTTIAGMEWTTGTMGPYENRNFSSGSALLNFYNAYNFLSRICPWATPWF